MKVCSMCGQEKPLEDFALNKTKRDGRAYNCKECQREYSKIHYKNHSKLYKSRAVSRHSKKREEFHQYKTNLKCSVCRENRWWLLDFHHINPEEKEYNMSRITDLSEAKVKEELSKCIVLCSNCHRDLHYKLRQ